MTAFALWISTFDARAQVAIAHQPDPAKWYGEATDLLQRHPIAAADLPKLQPGGVVASLAGDFSQFDWVEAGSYNFHDGQVDADYFPAKPCQLNLHRYDGGYELRFEYVAACATPTAGQIVHLNFQNPPPTSVSVVDQNGATWLKSVSYGEASMNRVVSYADGVLVVDVSRDGKSTSKPAIRTVYVAMPRRFEWKLGE
jgi:hypothetical protein